MISMQEKFEEIVSKLNGSKIKQIRNSMRRMRKYAEYTLYNIHWYPKWSFLEVGEGCIKGVFCTLLPLSESMNYHYT